MRTKMTGPTLCGTANGQAAAEAKADGDPTFETNPKDSDSDVETLDSRSEAGGEHGASSPHMKCAGMTET